MGRASNILDGIFLRGSCRCCHISPRFVLKRLLGVFEFFVSAAENIHRGGLLNAKDVVKEQVWVGRTTHLDSQIAAGLVESASNGEPARAHRGSTAIHSQVSL
jgi:hypothetical protein